MSKKEIKENLDMLLVQWNIVYNMKDNVKKAKHIKKLAVWIEEIENKLSLEESAQVKAV